MRTQILGAAALAALLLTGCRTARSTVLSLASPVLEVAAPGIETDCDETPHRVAPPADARRLRVGTWNLHYLGPSEETPREERSVRDLADYVRMAGVQVLALQEIGAVPGPRGPTTPTLDRVFGELAKDGADWTARLWWDPEDPSQCSGIAWDRRFVTETEPPVVLNVPRDPPGVLPLVRLPIQSGIWARRPFAVKLSTGPGLSDFVLVPVHMTARVETKFLFEDATAYREKEAEQLAVRLRAVTEHFRDRDLVVLGDFNTEFTSEGVTDALVRHGLRDLNCADLPTHDSGMSLDRFFVPDDQPEFALRPNFALVVPPGMGWDEFAERLSDHRMVVADLLVTRDDD